jgi:hypothetical protein
MLSRRSIGVVAVAVGGAVVVIGVGGAEDAAFA